MNPVRKYLTGFFIYKEIKEKAKTPINPKLRRRK
jgi:hypothetical protein